MTETRFGVSGTVLDAVFFTESSIPAASTIRHLAVETSRQNANLNDIKRRLAAEAQSCGATAVMNFRYGQRAHKWYEQLLDFKWDSESWYGEGDATAGP